MTRDLQLHLRALRQDAAHHLDVGLVVLDVVHEALVVVALGRRQRRRRSSAPCRCGAARGSVRMNVEPFAGGAARSQRAAHQLGQALADHQADAGAFDAPSARGRAG